MAPIMALIPNIFKATSMSLLFVSTTAKLRSLDSKRSWASLLTKTPFRCGCYLNLHQMDKHIMNYARALRTGPGSTTLPSPARNPNVSAKVVLGLRGDQSELSGPIHEGAGTASSPVVGGAK